jgi:hypothetical protein
MSLPTKGLWRLRTFAPMSTGPYRNWYASWSSGYRYVIVE